MANEGKQSPGATRSSDYQGASAGNDSKQAWVNGRGIFVVAITIAAFGVVLTALDSSHASGPSIFDFGAAPADEAAASAPSAPKPNGMVQSNVPERASVEAAARPSVEGATPSSAQAGPPGAKQLEPAASADPGAAALPKAP